MSRWTPRRPEYYVQTGSMLENPHGVPRDEVVRMILENPPEVTAQTVFGKYVESSGLVFTGELIQMLFDRSLPVIRGSSWVDREAAVAARALLATYGEWTNRYATGVDFGRQTDFTVIKTLDLQVMPARLVYYRRLNRVPWDSIYAEVGRARYLFGPNILGDSTGPGGDVVMDALEGRNYCPEHHRANLAGQVCTTADGKRIGNCKLGSYLPLSCVEGFQFTGPSKKELVEHLRNVLSVGYHSRTDGGAFGWIRLPPIPQTEEDMTFYAWDDKKLDTDNLFSLALAAWAGLEDVPSEPSVGSNYGT